jgi:PmbA protein
MVAADDVQRGRSPFADRIGEEIATPQLRLTDDGLDPGGLRSSPVDGEGVARRPVPVIEDGRLSTYLYDSYTARRAGTESTASAGRGSYRAPPSVSASNLVLEGGNGEAGSLLELAGEGVYVNEVAGLHSGVNPVSGTFSVGATGHRIGAGELAEPLAEFTIAGDLTTMLGSVSAIGKEARWVPFGGSVRTPEVLLGELTVSGA